MTETKPSRAQVIYDKMIALRTELVNSKPEERSEVARRIQITITELEKVMAYYNTFVLPLYY